MNNRDAILEGVHAANRLHHSLGIREAVESRQSSIDVFGAIVNLKVSLLFRPLDGLLGACLPETNPGVIISTNRPLHIQRFTGAHELGHIALRHAISVDGPEILEGAGQKAVDLSEVAANSFASWFLLPKWLLQLHARRQGWSRASMRDPRTVYQLALRAGASYEATCVALERHNIIDSSLLKNLLAVQPRKIKKDLLQGFPVANYFPDVWLLTEYDAGLTLEGQPDDIFIIRLTEKGGAGYLWTTKGLAEAGFAILRDTREIPTPKNSIGGPVTRILTARRTKPASGEFAVELKRQWEDTSPPIAKLDVTFELLGKEVGMPRAVRRHLRAA